MDFWLHLKVENNTNCSFLCIQPAGEDSEVIKRPWRKTSGRNRAQSH